MPQDALNSGAPIQMITASPRKFRWRGREIVSGCANNRLHALQRSPKTLDLYGRAIQAVQPVTICTAKRGCVHPLGYNSTS